MRQLLYLIALCVAFLSIARCQASEIKVQVFREAEMVQSVTLPEGKLKISVKDFNFDPTAKIWNLESLCAITIVQDEEHSIRLEGDSAKLSAEGQDIEWQVFAIHTSPVYDLAQLLKSHPDIQLVRLTWNFSMGGYGSSSTALYDRESKTLKEYVAWGDSNLGGGARENYLYEGVDDEIIYKANDDPLSDSAGPFSFGILRTYGIKQVERH